MTHPQKISHFATDKDPTNASKGRASAQEQYADAGDERVVSDTPAPVSQATI
jgi:hypothetical protein